MGLSLGRALLGRDVGRERKELEMSEADLQKEIDKQAEQQQKKGMWGSIGKTLGSIGAGTLGTMIGGPAGGILAAKMVGGYLGGRLGQSAVKTSKEGLRADTEGTYLGKERRALGRSAELAREDFDKASKGMKDQLLLSSVASPLMAYGAAEGVSGFGKDALLASGDKMSAWDALMSQSEFSPFMGSEEEAATKVATNIAGTGGNPLKKLPFSFGSPSSSPLSPF